MGNITKKQAMYSHKNTYTHDIILTDSHELLNNSIIITYHKAWPANSNILACK